MATDLQVNLALLASLSMTGIGLVLAAVGALSARRIGSPKLAWISGGFLLLALQGAWFARRIWADPRIATNTALVPAYLGLLALVALYIAIYRKP